MLTTTQKEAAWLLDSVLTFAARGSIYDTEALAVTVAELRAAQSGDAREDAFLAACVDYLSGIIADRRAPS